MSPCANRQSTEKMTNRPGFAHMQGSRPKLPDLPMSNAWRLKLRRVLGMTHKSCAHSRLQAHALTASESMVFKFRVAKNGASGKQGSCPISKGSSDKKGGTDELAMHNRGPSHCLRIGCLIAQHMCYTGISGRNYWVSFRCPHSSSSSSIFGHESRTRDLRT